MSDKLNILGYPMIFPRSQGTQAREGRVIAADIGGSRARLGLFQGQHGQLQLLNMKSYNTHEFDSFIQLFQSFYQPDTSDVRALCLGVAGPVIEGAVRGTNFPWVIKKKELVTQLPDIPVSILNDMEASAYGLGTLNESQLHTVVAGDPRPGNAALIAPGTGLGEVGIYFNGRGFRPFSSEGGHCDFAPRTSLEIDLWHYLKPQFHHISWERLISGPGILRIYQFLRQQDHTAAGKEQPFDNPESITKAALSGTSDLCDQTVGLFFKFLAVECAQLALKFNAAAGVFIGGSIVPQLITLLDTKRFAEHFQQAGRLQHYLQGIPVRVVNQENTPIWGAAAYALSTVTRTPRTS
ncbi:MAG: glucokinase [Cyclobacteriaceae bacterium]|nr:glucokinase [Cyclobacteriaceae bacterium]